ncbi:MAG: HemK/PrmC family methyltransferase [Owenweeksia sp.]|nr:HemK/PrmC family methyltransferase [Owenweeksia sp.]
MRKSKMKLKSLKSDYVKSLAGLYNKKEAERLFFIFLEEWGGIRKIDYLTDWDQEVGVTTYQLMSAALHRLECHEPYQHILGQVDFADLKLEVSASALIPRPETEELAELIRTYPWPIPPQRILDVGTGTGCLALACAKSFKNARVSAIDISAEAIKLATGNAVNNQLEVAFHQVDFLKDSIVIAQSWDLIVSNPPYIATEERRQIERLVKDHDPEIALFVAGADPLLFYRALAAFGQRQLSNSGRMFVEINERLGAATLRILRMLVTERICSRI